MCVRHSYHSNLASNIFNMSVVVCFTAWKSRCVNVMCVANNFLWCSSKHLFHRKWMAKKNVETHSQGHKTFYFFTHVFYCIRSIGIIFHDSYVKTLFKCSLRIWRYASGHFCRQHFVLNLKLSECFNECDEKISLPNERFLCFISFCNTW